VLSTTQSYRQLTKDLTRTLDTTASKAFVKRESKYYLDNIAKVKSIDDFVGNRRLFSYAMKAFGLEDMTYAKAFVRKALVEGVENRNSFANRLVDTRLKEFVTAFNFERRGEFTTGFPEVQQGAVDRFVRQTLEEEVGQQNEGVRLALYFERKAAAISGPFAILADKALLRVAQVALDIPSSASSQGIDKQAALIEQKLPVSTLKDPKKLKAFLEKFTVKWELANPTSSGAPPILQSVIPASSGVNSSILAALQNLKLGGR
jgi:hypothetical protein